MKKLLKQALGFVGLSGIGWCLDFLTYTVLGIFSENLILNNEISSWVGVTFVFIFSTRKVFQNQGKISLKWKYVIYVAYQCVLIYLSSKLLNVLAVYIVENMNHVMLKQFSALIAKILVTPFTLTLNFFVMKGMIEKL